jgi:hypothetical protein
MPSASMARRTAKVFMTTSVQSAAIGGDRETRILSGGVAQ